jgi:UDP-N-acetylglucosamine acyltransferase
VAASIHPSAVIATGAEIGEGAIIGPYCVIGADAKIGAGCELKSHVVIDGHTSLGAGCVVFPFANLGGRTQDKKFKGGAPRVEIGARTTVRESATVNAATFDGGVTKVGDDCLLMAYSHVAHDCIVGNGVIMANSVALAGHIIVEDRAIIGGLTGIHQFVRIGKMSMIGGLSRVVKDIPPFMIAEGNPLEVNTINSVGLERAGASAEVQQALKLAYKILYRQNLNTKQAVEKLRAEVAMSPEVEHLLKFIESSERGITK